ncbi:MAG: electron transport complex subunit RsxE [Bacilli bacterium]|nr:electron transport complex subunit RsxE [Bacilli bacterium]
MNNIKRGQHKASFLNGILKENPLLIQVLGLCPALAVTKSLETAFGMGLLFTFVLVSSNVIVSLLRKLIPEEIRTPSYIVVIATFVTIVKMFTEAFLPELYSSLGVFLSLLVVNCIVLGRAEAFAGSNGVFDSFLDGVGNGIGYTWAISLMGIIREVLGLGTLTIGKVFTFFPEPLVLPILKSTVLTSTGDPLYDYSISLFQNPAGAFIVLGLMLGVMAAITNHKKAVEKAKEKAAKEASKLEMAAKAALAGGAK